MEKRKNEGSGGMDPQAMNRIRLGDGSSGDEENNVLPLRTVHR